MQGHAAVFREQPNLEAGCAKVMEVSKNMGQEMWMVVWKELDKEVRMEMGEGGKGAEMRAYFFWLHLC